jgi:hypothetical protein
MAGSVVVGQFGIVRQLLQKAEFEHKKRLRTGYAFLNLFGVEVLFVVFVLRTTLNIFKPGFNFFRLHKNALTRQNQAQLNEIRSDFDEIR